MHFHKHSLKEIFHEHLNKKEGKERKSIDKISFNEVSNEILPNDDKQTNNDTLFDSSLKNSQLLKYSFSQKSKSNASNLKSSYSQMLLNSRSCSLKHSNTSLNPEPLLKSASVTHRSQSSIDRTNNQFGTFYCNPNIFPLMTPYQKMKSKSIRDKMIIDFNQHLLKNKHKEVNKLIINATKKKKIVKVKVNEANNTHWYFHNFNLKMSRIPSKEIINPIKYYLQSPNKQSDVINIESSEKNKNYHITISKSNSGTNHHISSDLNISKSDMNNSLKKQQFMSKYFIIGNKKLSTAILQNLAKLKKNK